MADDGWKPLSPEDFAAALAEPGAEPPTPPAPVITEQPEVTAVRTRTLEERLLVAQEMGLARNILKQLAFIGPRSRTIEIQVLGVRRNQNDSFERVKAAHGATDDQIVELCTEADSWTSHGIYFLPAKLRAGVETRHSSLGKWYELSKGGGTTDNDVEARLILAIDFDVKRSAGISATDEELQRSVRIATRAWEFLAGALGGTDSMALLHSGNGRQIHLALDAVPTNDEAKNLAATILAGMDSLFSTDEVKVDRNLFDAKRILPACGTLKKKGAPGIDERPHRRTAIVTPDVVQRLSFQQLVLLSRAIYDTTDGAGQAAMYAAAGKRPTQASNVSPLTPSKDSPFGRANSIPASEVAQWLGIINNQGDAVCPGCSNTKGVSLLSGGLKCFHNTCAQKGVPGKPGFRTNVDLVMEARGLSNIEAVKVLGDRFGFDGSVGPPEPTRESQGQAQTPPLPAYSAAPLNSPVIDSKWRDWSPEEIYAPIPPIDWLVEGVIPRATVGLIAAYGSSLKSWAALDLLDAIACGRPWLQRFKCGKGRAYLVDFESGSFEVRRRLQAIAQGRGQLDPVQNLGFVSFPPDFLTSPAFITEITRRAERHDVIVIDTLAAGSPGADENDSRFAAPLNLLKGIAEKTGCSFLILHHTRKQRDGEDEREGTRGTSAIFNALDFELKLFRFKEDGSFTCKQTKARQGKKVDPFLVKILEPAEGRVTVYAEMLTGAQEQVEVEAELNEFKKRLLSIIQATPGLNAGSIQQRAKKNRDSVLTALREMVKANQILLIDGGYVSPGATPEPGSRSSGNSGEGSRVPPPVGGNPELGSVLREDVETTKSKLARQAAELSARAESDATAMEGVAPKERQGWALQQGWETRRTSAARAILTLWDGGARRDVEILQLWRAQGVSLDGLAARAREAGWTDPKNPKRLQRATDLLPKPNVRIANLAYDPEAANPRANPEKPPLLESRAPAAVVAEVAATVDALTAETPEEDAQAERDADALVDLFPKEQKALMKDWSKERRWRAKSALDKRAPKKESE